MLRQPRLEHKRKNSSMDLFHPQKQKQKSLTSKQQKQKPSASHSKKPPRPLSQKSSNSNRLKLSNRNQNDHNSQPQPQQIFKLLQNSSLKIPRKQTLVDGFQVNDQNRDYSNGAVYLEGNHICYNQQQQQEDESQDNCESFFQFGRRSRASSVRKEQVNDSCGNHQCLNMEEITQVPDTMSNERRYQNNTNRKALNCNYPLNSSKQNSLANFSNKLIDDSEPYMLQSRNSIILQPKKLQEKFNSCKPSENQDKQKRCLKKRKDKGPKNVVIQNEGSLQTKNKSRADLIDLLKANSKKAKLVFNTGINGRKDEKQSKSREQLRNVEKDRSKATLTLTAKSKNMSQSILPKKKSLSLKNQAKNALKLQKPSKSSQKQLLNNSLPCNAKPSKPYKPSKPSQKPCPGSTLQINQKILLIQQSQSKLQNQYKILWQCVGQLWENSRITRYISEKNKSDIMKIKEGEKGMDQRLIKLKGEIISSIASARY